MITNDIKGQIRLIPAVDLLYHPIKTEADGCILQEDHNTLHRWSKRLKLAFNTNVMSFILRGITVELHRYNIGGTVLTPVEHHPYLGIELDNKQCWKQQVSNARSKGTRYLLHAQKELYKMIKTTYNEPDIHALSAQCWNMEAVVALPMHRSTNMFECSRSTLYRTKQHDTSIGIGSESRVRQHRRRH